jgi:hypothetical protein
MFTVPSGFIAVFKTGDNINHNLRILKLLYAQYEEATAGDRQLLCKPITIILISIIEAALQDFHFRCSKFTWEKVTNLADGVASIIRGKKLSKLSHYIQSAKKHGLFGEIDGEFYDTLELLSKLRNRVHIQNENNDLEPDEWNAFTPQRLAERSLEQVIKILAAKYPRPEHIAGFVRDFDCPWTERVNEREGSVIKRLNTS